MQFAYTYCLAILDRHIQLADEQRLNTERLLAVPIRATEHAFNELRGKHSDRQ